MLFNGQGKRGRESGGERKWERERGGQRGRVAPEGKASRGKALPLSTERAASWSTAAQFLSKPAGVSRG